MPESNQIVFFDTTLRDGEQSPGCTMHPAEKLRMAHQLAALGVDILEAGFAIASKGDFDSVRAIAARGAGPRIASLARCKREDIEAAARAVEPAEATASTSSSPPPTCTSRPSCGSPAPQALDQAAGVVRLARTFCRDVEFSTEDGTRTDPDFLVQMITVAVQAGATTINIPDTVGYTTPAEYTAHLQAWCASASPASSTPTASAT